MYLVQGRNHWILLENIVIFIHWEREREREGEGEGGRGRGTEREIARDIWVSPNFVQIYYFLFWESLLERLYQLTVFIENTM